MTAPTLHAPFVVAATRALNLVAHPATAERWDAPSVLDAWTVGGLAGHLTRAVSTVSTYLERDEPTGGGDPVDAAGYLLAVLGDDDLAVDSALATTIRSRGDDAGAVGPAALFARVRDELDALDTRLADVDGGRRLEVLDGVVLSLDDYLATRILELVVHGDDLATSIDVAADLPTPVVRVATDLAVEVARRRRGELVLLRALTRRERVDVPLAV